jgi:hypothetical protein
LASASLVHRGDYRRSAFDHASFFPGVFVKKDVGVETHIQLRRQLLEHLKNLTPRTVSRFKQGDLAGRVVRTCEQVGEG